MKNTARKITAEQLEALFDFVRRKRIRHYDLQVELVDHFATGIEQLWEEDPDLSFTAAIDKLYSDFPITGFASVQDQQSQAMQKQAWKWVLTSWASYFQWPRLLMSLAIIFSLRLLFFLPVTASWLFWAGATAIIIIWAWIIYQSKKVVGKSGKRFLRLEATYSVVGMFLNMANSVFILSYATILDDMSTFPAWAAWTLAIIFTGFGFLTYILFHKLPQRAMDDLRRQFPKYV